MANIAITSDAWTEISITSGTVQNISATADIELSAEQTDNSGVVLKPSEIYQWDNETIYARAVTESTGALRVVNFKRAAGGGGYVLPVASISTLGGVKVGTNLSINENGVLSATGGGSSNYDPVGRVVFDVILRDGYIKANGAAVSDASTSVPNLLQFVQDNSATLLAADSAAYAANVGLYLYDSGTDELTLPNYIDRYMAGAASISALDAKIGTHAHILPSSYTGGSAVYGWQGSWPPGTADPLSDDTEFGAGFTRGSNDANGTTAYSGLTWAVKSGHTIYDDDGNTRPKTITMIPQIKY